MSKSREKRCAAASSIIAKSLLDAEGFAIVPGVLDQSAIAELIQAVQDQLSSSSAGTRNLANTVQAVARLAHSPAIRELIEPVLRKNARLVRSVFFNKTRDINWHVAWHQDLSIAVQEKAEVEGFGRWSIKDGVHHVQPPTSILENMLTVRLHLDDTDETNGALRVLAGSHLLGRVPAEKVAELVPMHRQHVCKADAGDVLLLRPLLVHASSKVTSARSRRVIHLEFAGAALPDPLLWLN